MRTQLYIPLFCTCSPGLLGSSGSRRSRSWEASSADSGTLTGSNAFAKVDCDAESGDVKDDTRHLSLTSLLRFPVRLSGEPSASL